MAYKKKSTGKIKKKDGKYKIKQNKEIDIEIVDEGTEDFEVDMLDMTDLPPTVQHGDQTLAVTWYNNFSIKKGGNYINQSFKVKLPGAKTLRDSGKFIVLFDGNSNNGNPYIFTGNIADDDTFELTDGDPAIGSGPP